MTWGNRKSYLINVAKTKKAALIKSKPKRKASLAKHGLGGGSNKATCLYQNGTRQINMRSSWEVKYALWLDRNKYTWLYEPRPFTVKNGRKYYPDFYVKELDEWHEVKGIFTDVSKQKVAEFRELYPKLILKMLFKDDLKALGVL
jgi:hypothetical protein